MDTSIVTTKGQVVIPSKLRRKFGIRNGTRIHFYELNGEIRMIPLTHELVDSNIGFLSDKGKHHKNLEDEKMKEH